MHLSITPTTTTIPTALHRDLQSHLDQFLLDCARHDFVPPAIIKSLWAREQLGYLQEIVDTLGEYDPRRIRSYQRNERTPATIRRHLEEYLNERLERWQTRERIEKAVSEAKAYFQQQGFDPALATTPRSTRTRRSVRGQEYQEGESGANYRLMSGSLESFRRSRRQCYYTRIEELVGKRNR